MRSLELYRFDPFYMMICENVNAFTREHFLGVSLFIWWALCWNKRNICTSQVTDQNYSECCQRHHRAWYLWISRGQDNECGRPSAVNRVVLQQTRRLLGLHLQKTELTRYQIRWGRLHTNYTEIEEITTLDVRYNWLVCLFETYPIQWVQTYEPRIRVKHTFKNPTADSACIFDIFQEVGMFLHSRNIEGWKT